MADFFLLKTPLALENCLSHDGQLVLEQHQALSAALGAVSPGAEALFAEPLISRGNDQAAASVSWYADADGKPVPLDRLDGAARSNVIDALRARLGPLTDHLDDPEHGALLSRALYTLDAGSITSVAGQPVILNWGMLPEGLERDRSARAKHFSGTLGAYLDLPAPPPLGPSEARSYREKLVGGAESSGGTPVAAPAAAAAAIGAGAAAAGASAAGASPPPPDQPGGSAPTSPPPADRRAGPGGWIPLAVLTLLALAVLIWLLIPGVRLFPDDPGDQAISDEAAVALAQDVNRALEERLAGLQGALEGAQCRADGTLLMPDGMTIEGLLPPDPRDPNDRAGAIRPADPTPILPPDPERIAPPGVTEGSLDTGNLLALIESRTALVIAVSPSGMGLGTGFFVAPDLLVTNFHVIEGAPNDSIFVTNEALGELRGAEVLSALGPLDRTGGDFALLRVPGANSPAFDILRPTESLRLQNVIAAGYPGDLMRTDTEFAQLRNGDLSAVPALAVTDGSVSVEQTMAPRQTDVVVHSAPISTGNSGGPLIDTCGRVVGVNTFVVQGPLRNLNFALASSELLGFLQSAGALPNVVSQPCRPQVARPSPPPAEVAAAPAGAATATPVPALPAPTPTPEATPVPAPAQQGGTSQIPALPPLQVPVE
ncbi:trypsin-like peptidase domain-containing protein [Tropicimonas sp. S265A]|uniref:trypsin-like peptidase domain-containing protein n=1 Tax=Tropicimonas sp. S265A TaxID=3415134 RepID=UPI003C7D249F